MTTIALDVGQSGLRLVRLHAAAEQRLEGHGSAVWLADEPTAVAMAAHLASAIDAVDDTDDASERPTVLVGLSGFDPGGHLASVLARELGHLSRAQSVVVASDVVAWHLAAVPTGSGIVSVLGTGSVTLAADGTGNCHRVDGWGHTIGDEASGFAVGRAGLASALRSYDGRAGSARLLSRAIKHYGTVESLVAAINGAPHPASEVARFATDVVSCACEGDSSAIAILDSVGGRLGEAIIAAYNTIFEPEHVVPVRMTGGLAGASVHLMSGVRAALHEVLPHLDPVAIQLDPLDGVRRLCAAVTTSYPGLAVAWEAR